MKKPVLIITALIVLIIFALSFSVTVQANAAEPPGFLIIVQNPPADLVLSLQLPGEPQPEQNELQKEQKAWETYYRFFYHQTPLGHIKLDDAVLIVRSSAYDFQIPLPADTFKTYNNLLTLDLPAQTLTAGQSWLRVALLVTMRVVLTMLIEGVIFLLFGYRSKRSWLVFLAINFVTQIGLNILFTGPMIGPYWLIGFVVVEIMVIIVEIIAFAVFIKEHKKSRAVLFAIVANLASLIAGGWLIANLPV
jgi:hypothetical protein